MVYRTTLNIKSCFTVIYTIISGFLTRLLCRIFFYVDKWGSSLDHGKSSCYKFIFNNVYYQYFRFSFRLFPMVILPQFCVETNSTNRGHIKHSFHLFISDRIHFGTPPVRWFLIGSRAAQFPNSKQISSNCRTL